ncbi:hypothetical protein [Myceligenerans salitolerans]|uniref:Fibronectin type-III domain-containing protein n=1 Tax=Myceligenerans salitolerans TaxID=1230528 RepID=A0ABS3I3P1_9MICO|nr:hypothetical protein [Myceligenerans salitolerans]MBO0607600.1 hypothetical protein [Myceligenerans salitolerans]
MSGARRRTAAAALTGLLLGAVIGAGTAPAWAWWTDQATVRSGAVAAATVPAPAAACGPVGVASVRFNWTAVPGATSYVVHFGANGSMTRTVTGTTFTTTQLVSSGTFWVVAQREFPGTTWVSANSNRLDYVVAVVSLCG